MNNQTTERDSHYQNLETLSINELLEGINAEDQKVAACVALELSNISLMAEAILVRLSKGGRLFYIGSGTSGRLGIVDASECPPTYGVPHGMVVGIIAGGDQAIRKAVENAEDDVIQGWLDLEAHHISEQDFVLGISASGKTPYVKWALAMCKSHGIETGSLSCNKNSEIGALADFSIEVEVGPEFVTGSTRMKSGTAQKMILNMITTSVMVKLGKVKGNKMVDMQLTNAKLIDRGTKMIINETRLDYESAKNLLIKYGSVRDALNAFHDNLKN